MTTASKPTITIETTVNAPIEKELHNPIDNILCTT
jgi:hypothetical protein